MYTFHMRKSIALLFLYYVGCTINNPVAYIEVPSNPISSTQAPQPTAPDAPTGLVIASGNAQTSITWQPVANATSYNIYWSLTTGTNKTSNKMLNVASPYPHTGLTNGTKYYYVVTSVSNGLESSESLEISEYAGIIDNHDGSVFIAHLNQTWQKCSDNYYNAVTDSCDVAGYAIHKYCITHDHSCDDGTSLTSGDAFNVCATSTLNGGGWRVPTGAEMLAFYPYHPAGIVKDWHWATNALPVQLISMWDGAYKQPIFRYDPGYVVCVK